MCQDHLKTAFPAEDLQNIKLYLSSNKCPLCHLKFPSPEARNHHMNQRHPVPNMRRLQWNRTLRQFRTAFLDGCLRRCGVCSFESYNLRQFFDHVHSLHSLDKESYLALYGNPLREVCEVQCQLCSESFVHDEKEIQTHLITKHRLTWMDYAQERLRGLEVTRQARKRPLDESDYTSLLGDRAFGTPSAGHVNPLLDLFRQCISKAFCPICEHRIPTVLEDHLPEFHQLDVIQFQDWEMPRPHIWQCHPTRLQQRG